MQFLTQGVALDLQVAGQRGERVPHPLILPDRRNRSGETLQLVVLNAGLRI